MAWFSTYRILCQREEGTGVAAGGGGVGGGGGGGGGRGVMTAGSFSVARINTAILVAWAAAGSNSSSANMLNWRGCGAGAEHIDEETCSSIMHILQLRRVKGIAATPHARRAPRGDTWYC
jgi:hypothetical protein